MEGMDLLHEGMYDLGDRSYVQLRRISADMMQYRRHTVDISRSSRPSEGIPRASSEDEAARTCWVGGIPNGLPAKAVEELFGQFGEVESATIRNKGSERGAGARSRPDQMLPCALTCACAPADPLSGLVYVRSRHKGPPCASALSRPSVSLRILPLLTSGRLAQARGRSCASHPPLPPGLPSLQPRPARCSSTARSSR